MIEDHIFCSRVVYKIVDLFVCRSIKLQMIVDWNKTCPSTRCLMVSRPLVSTVSPIGLDVLQVVHEQRPEHVHVITVALQEFIGLEHWIALAATSNNLIWTIVQGWRIGRWRLVCRRGH